MSNPFGPSEPTGGGNPFAANPFAPSQPTTTTPTTFTTSHQQIKLVSSQLKREPNLLLRHLAVHGDNALCVYESKSGETVLSRRHLNSLSQDGSLQVKERISGLYMNADATLVLVQQSPSNQTFTCNPQHATLKLKGPENLIQTPLASVNWVDFSAVAMVVGLANGQVKQVTLGPNSSAALVCQLPSPCIAALHHQDNLLILFEQSGKISSLSMANGSSKSVRLECDLTSELVQVHRDEDDAEVFWLLTRSGLYKWRLRGAAPQLVFAQEHCFAMSHTRLFLLVLCKQANKQSTAVLVKLHAISKLTHAVLSLAGGGDEVKGNAFGFARDALLRKTWLLSTDTAVLVEIQNETHGAWRVYLDRAKHPDSGRELDFQLALDLSPANNQASRDLIFAAQAEYHFSKGNWVRSAELFAEIVSGKSFEAICLKFSPHKTALRVFLTGKLSKLQDGKKKALQVMLGVWICEVSLEEMNLVDDDNNGGDNAAAVEAFAAFLGQYAAMLEPAKDIIFHLLLSHGRMDMLLVYSHLTQDFDRVVEHHLAQRSWRDAALALQEFAQPALAYKYSPVLIDHVPELLVREVWHDLDVIRLMPSLSQIASAEHPALPFALEFLEEHAAGVRDETVHNLLLSLYALRERDEDKLFAYIKLQTNQAGGPYFDHGFALRVCETASPRSRVNLLDALNVPEAALQTALDLGMEDAAFRIAGMQTQNDLAAGKRLWKLCCERAVGLEQQLQVVSKSEGVLGMEDLLDMLDSSVRVEDVRRDVCAALDQHQDEIEQLKRDMKEHTDSAQALRRDAAEEQQRFDVVRCGKHCDTCGKRVLSGEAGGGDVFVFPCTHVFHSSCLFRQVLAHLPGGERRDRIARLQQSKTLEDQALFDEIIGASCPYCGELMIQSVSQPVLFAKDEAEARSWD
ncbi:hypothetical protein BASA81_012819 [Batrachochytrium salamandrivorans]|nr:hypothetical protein BASA81_012819 [Batrachochytrium salamandrivorans]